MIDPRFTSPTEQRDYWPILRTVLLVAIVALAGRFLVRYFDPDARVAGKQRQNQERLEFFVQALEKHREWEGTYPLNLVDSLQPTRVPGGVAQGLPLRDAWGHPLRYFSDGKIFILASVGRDGKPGEVEYHELRQDGVALDVCHRPDADIVVSDMGWHVACRPFDGGASENE